MQAIDIKSLIDGLTPISPDRRYSIAWASSGVIGVRKLKDNEQVLVLHEKHGAILKAGFSQDMQQLIAINEDNSISIWFIKPGLTDSRKPVPGDIVEFIGISSVVPYLNIMPTPNGAIYHYSLHDASEAIYEWYDWGDYNYGRTRSRLQEIENVLKKSLG